MVNLNQKSFARIYFLNCGKVFRNNFYQRLIRNVPKVNLYQLPMGLF
jgi:hypothetical protein